MSRYDVITPITLLFLLSSCAQLPDDYGLYQEPPSAWTVEQNNNRISTIEGLVQSGKSGAGKQQADLINSAELTDAQAAKFGLLCAQILLSFGEAEQAAQKLGAIDPGQLSINDKIKYGQSRAFAYSLTGNLLESVKTRITLDPILSRPDERKKNQALILESLSLLPESVLKDPKNQTGGLPEWMWLAKILGTRDRNPANLTASLSAWRSANPQHPANIYLDGLANSASNDNAMPKSIAILLPESGPYADAGRAVKAGFLAAMNRDHSGNKPQLHFYDTETAAPVELYRKAVEQGAKLVIGPLNKDNIQDLASAALLDTPVLALNHVPDLNKANLYQFALSPMDDVAEITRQAALDGHKRALLLVPENEQSKRVVSYFKSSWQAQNGTIADSQTYDPKTANYASVIKKLLRLDESEARSEKVAGYFPGIKSVAHQQVDADALFLSAYNKEGRAIIAQLQLAGNFPVYAMPAIYSGITDPADDSSLNGVTFCDMPWLFNAAYGGELSMLALRDIWSQFPSSYLRLLAMGIDAYQLSARLPTLSTMPFPGATGHLSLSEGNRVKRSLVCAKFNKGQPELIGHTHSPSE